MKLEKGKEKKEEEKKDIVVVVIVELRSRVELLEKIKK